MKNFILFSLLVITSFSSQAQTPCSLDNSFASGGKLVADGSRLGEYILVQTDGKILIACNAFGNGSAYIKRFNTDGSVDATYGTAGSRTITVAEIATRITGLAFYNGNVYLCGTTTTNIGGTNTYVYVAALDATGNFINSFGVNGIAKFNTAPNKLYISSDICVSNTGEIFVAGVKSFAELFVMKLNPTGGFDNSFDTDGIHYVNTNNVNQWFDVVDMDIDKSNKIVIAGKKYKANNGNTDPLFWNIMMMRFNTNGSLDNTFANAGIGLYNSNAANLDESKKLLVTSVGDYIVCGDTYDGVDYDYTAVKIRIDGTIDNSFGTSGWAIHDLEYNNEIENPLNAALMADGRILITGNQGSGDTVYFCLLMLKPDGTRDFVFATNGVYKNIFNLNNNSSSSGMALTGDGKIVLAGYTRTCQNGTCGPLYMAVSRYLGGTIGSPAATTDLTIDNSISIYPDPVSANSSLHFLSKGSTVITDVQLFDMQGRNLFALYDKTNGTLKINSYAAGLYNCRINTTERVVSRMIFIK